jgi:hypothetical protein
MSRRLTRSYAAANLEDMQPAIALPARLRKRPRPRNANDTESDGDTLDTPSENPERDQPAEHGELGKTVAPPVGKDAADSANGVTKRQSTALNRKIVPPRSPLPSRATRPIHPGAPDMVKPKRTSAEVTAAAERKAVLQCQADELEQKRIDTLAEMELEEELAEEEAERTVVRTQAHADSLDDAEDVIMQSEDEENKCPSVPEEIFELSTSEEDAQAAKARVVPKKRSQVSSSSNVAEVTNTDVPP